MPRPQRPTADKTRQKIITAARKIFLAKGFDAAYMKDIAQLANVNTNLIFHHFTNKETLWKRVKADILFAQAQRTPPHYDVTSAKAFFHSVLEYRFSLYVRAPDLVRLIQWQQLTENESALVGDDDSSPMKWLDTVRRFQAQGDIIDTIDAEQIMLFIIFSTHAPFLQQVIPLTDAQTQQYQQMIYDMCCAQFIR